MKQLPVGESLNRNIIVNQGRGKGTFRAGNVGYLERNLCHQFSYGHNIYYCNSGYTHTNTLIGRGEYKYFLGQKFSMKSSTGMYRQSVYLSGCSDEEMDKRKWKSHVISLSWHGG